MKAVATEVPSLAAAPLTICSAPRALAEVLRHPCLNHCRRGRKAEELLLSVLEPGASLLSEGLMQRELAASAIAAVACSGICRLPRGPPVLWSASTSAVCWPKATGQTMGNVRAMQAAGRATYGTAHLYGSRWSIGSCWAMLHSQGHDQPGGPSGQQSMRSDGRAHIPTRQAGAARQEPARPARGSAHPGHAEASGHQQQQRVGQRAGLYREG